MSESDTGMCTPACLIRANGTHGGEEKGRNLLGSKEIVCVCVCVCKEKSLDRGGSGGG